MATHKKRFVLGFALSVVTFLIHAMTARAEIIDRVVAVVDEDVITLSEVNEAGQEQFAAILRNSGGKDVTGKLAEARKDVLDGLIDKRLVAQRAKELHISISEKDIDNAFQGILKRNNISKEEFTKQLAVTGRTDRQFRDSLSEQLLFSRVMVLEIRSKIVLSDTQVEAFYKAHHTKNLQSGQYQLLQIGFNWSDSHDTKEGTAKVAGKDEARKQAERIRKLAMQGKDFRELARSYSELPSAADGGEIGVLHKDEVSSAMSDALSGLLAGGISQVIETENTFQFFKVLAAEGDAARLVSFDAVRQEIEDRLFRQETERLYEKWLQDRRQQVYIEIL